MTMEIAGRYFGGPQGNAHDSLVEALKYAHKNMQPFCDDGIVKEALKQAGAE